MSLMSKAFRPGALRLFLAALVVLSHVSSINVGRLAVFLFFSLSGYWIAVTYSKTLHKSASPIRSFYLSRFFRVYPLYIISQFSCFLVFSKSDSFPISAFLLFGLATTGQDYIGVSWSLDIEFQFYLIAPFLIAIMEMTNPGARAVTLTTLSIIGWVAGFALEREFGVSSALSYLPAFLAGVLIRYQTPSIRTVYLSTALGATTIGAFYMLGSTINPLAKANTLEHTDALLLLIGLSFVPAIAMVLKNRSSQLDLDFGGLSYPLYLVHYPIIRYIIHNNQFIPPEVAKAIAVLLSIIVGIALYVTIDRPLEKLRKRYSL